MWGFIVALISGALMSIQGVFNTEVTKQTSFCSLCSGLVFYRTGKCGCTLAGGQ